MGILHRQRRLHRVARVGTLLLLTVLLYGCGDGEDTTSNSPSISIPPSSAASLSALNTRGLTALRNNDIVGARDIFKDAVSLAGSETSQEPDTARFFYALTRMAALGFPLVSDENPHDLNTVTDFLDLLGCHQPGSDPLSVEVSCPTPLPATSPTGGEVQDFLQNVARSELVGAVANLTIVSSSFQRGWTQPFTGKTVESDFGDVLFFRAVGKGLLGFIAAQMAYDLEVNIATAVNNQTVETFLDNNPTFPPLVDRTPLPTARDFLRDALDDLLAAITTIAAETDDQSDDFITLQSMTAEKIEKAKIDVADLKNALDGPTPVSSTLLGLSDSQETVNNDFTLDVRPFFAGIDLRQPNLLPPFVGNELAGLFPDPTFRGIIGPEIDLNEDLDGDGVPDILQR